MYEGRVEQESTACSVLHPKGMEEPALRPKAPPCFHDLNLDQIVGAITASKEEYDLQPFYFTLLQEIEAVEYRQAVFKDLEEAITFGGIKAFENNMRLMRRAFSLSSKLEYRHEKARWLLESVLLHCRAAEQLAGDLARAPLESAGLSAIREYLLHYVSVYSFKTMKQEAEGIEAELARIRYCLWITDGPAVRVQPHEADGDYASEVEELFARFRVRPQKDYHVEIRTFLNMNHVDAAIAGFVERLFPEQFARLFSFCDQYAGFPDKTLMRFEREIQFFVSYIEFTREIRQAGLPFCYPVVSVTEKNASSEGGYDLALAELHVRKRKPIVPNDFAMEAEERILVVTGPNSGGKTTFARSFGQLHFLAGLGCPVPGRRAKLLLADEVFTHFGREEYIEDLQGRLEDDLVRIRDVLGRSTPRSVIVMNEIFASTTVQDALLLARRVLAKIIVNDSLGVLVTFLDELASMSPQTVSMVATVHKQNPTERTFRVVRAAADGLAYALTLAAAHGLTHDLIVERIAR